MDIRVHLAPMAGITDSAMRVLSTRFGADCTYTEMVSAAGLANNSERTFLLLEKLPEEASCVAHLYGADVDYMERAAAVIAEHGGFCGIDINGGCPVQKITRSGAGASLMRNPQLVEKLVAAAVKGSGGMPVSFKTRIGLHAGEVTIFDIAKAVENGGASQIAVHGRFASREHRGDVDYDLLHQAKERVSIKFVANGGIRMASDVQKMHDALGPCDVMIGQGAMGNPWIFSAIKELLSSNVAESQPCHNEIMRILMEHFSLSMQLREQIRSKYREEIVSKESPELASVHDFRRFMFNYFKGRKGVTDLRRDMNKYNTISDVMSAINQYIVDK